MKTKPNNTCPQCGAPLPTDALAGLCPACVMAMNLATPTMINEDGSTSRVRFEAPALADIIPLFPQLEIIELLGQGGMGAVYKARQKELDRFVALKILPKEVGETAGFAERFAREARVLGKLNHPNIVTLHEFGHVDMDDGDPLYYFLMEYVDGLNLRSLLNNGRVEAREALSIVPRICDALQYAHDEGIVHRDIKPENILLDRRGNVKVADFGLAKIVGAKEEMPDATEAPTIGDQQSTIGNVIMGTPKYMSPEQVAAPGEVDHRADIFALGVVFYQMLTGEMPDDQLQPPSKKVHIDVRLDEVVLRALERNPERRYQQASVLKTDVETIESKAAPAKASITQTELDQMYRDPANWRLYFFYFCKQDPRVIVPKRISGLGWTINCANPWSVPFFLVLIGVLMTIVKVSSVAGLTGQALLGVKIALIFGVVWMCHKLSLAREVVPAKTRLRRRVAALAVVAVGVVASAFFIEKSTKPTAPRSTLEQLASNPQKLRKQSTEKIIAAGLSNIPIPWAWKELSDRAAKGGLSSEQVALLVDSFVELMQREYPAGYQQPLWGLGDLFETLARENLLSEADKLRIRTHMIGAPELAPLPRVVEGKESMHTLIQWRSPWNKELFGYAQLNRLKAVRVNGVLAKVAVSDSSSRNADHLSFSVALPELAPGVYRMECEVDAALVSAKSIEELDPPAIKQWARACATEFSVVAMGSSPAHGPMIASRNMERMDSGGMKYEWSAEPRVPTRLCHHSFWLGSNGELVGYWGAVDEVATEPGTVAFSLSERVVSNKLNYAMSRGNSGVSEKVFAMPDCDETRTLMLAASEPLSASYTPLWMREFLKKGVVVKTLVFAARLVGDDEAHAEPQTPNVRGIRDYASKMVVVPDTWPETPPLPEPVSLEFRPASRSAGPGRTEMRILGDDSPVYVSNRAVLSNADVRWADVVSDPQGPRIEIMFTEAGARRFAELTASHVGELLAILLEGRLVSAPTIVEEIRGGRVQIAGGFSETEARRLAAGLVAERQGPSSATTNRASSARKEADEFRREYADLGVADNAMMFEGMGMEPFIVGEKSPDEQQAQLPPIRNNTRRQTKSVTITLAAGGTVMVDGASCPPEQLGDELKRLAEAGTGSAVIRADKETSHKQILTMMDACAAAGIEQIRFAVKESIESEDSSATTNRASASYGRARWFCPVG